MVVLSDIGWIVQFCEEKVSHLLLSPGSSFSLASLSSALFIAVCVILWRRRPRGREVGFRLMLRALFPRWLYRHASFRADLGFLLFNLFAWGILFGWATISARYFSDLTTSVLGQAFGAAHGPKLPAVLSRSLATLGLFLAYEFGYWTHHYLSHRIPLFWEFHKVHHTAEILTPITNYRVHPIDTVFFYNVMAVFLGTAGGALAFVLGQGSDMFAISGTNVILVGFMFATTHLQHSHVWIAVTGPLGRVVLSPAHHQLHHSTDPAHFNKNFGSCLALWDWLFGTLHMPTRARQRLTFGVEPLGREHHTAVGAMLVPVVEALGTVLPKGRPSVPAPAAAPAVER